MKRLLIMLTATLFLTATWALAGSVKIGMITTLSGGGSALGIAVRDGFKLAMDQEGGKLGGYPVQLLVDDDSRKPDKAKQISDRFIKRDNVHIMTGIIWSNLAITVVLAIAAWWLTRRALAKDAGESIHQIEQQMDRVKDKAFVIALVLTFFIITPFLVITVFVAS